VAFDGWQVWPVSWDIECPDMEGFVGALVGQNPDTGLLVGAFVGWHLDTGYLGIADTGHLVVG